MLPVSLSFAAALALLNLWLAYRVVRIRQTAKVLVGDGAHPLLTARMRAQANFVEYSPFVLALVALIELAGGPVMWLRGVTIVYLLGRVAHAFGMDRHDKPHALRGIGALVTWLTLLGLALWALVLVNHAPVRAEHITMF